MALYLRDPRKAKTPNFEIRGTYLRVRVEQSSGTDRRRIALQELHKIERAIEAGTFRAPKPVDRPDGPTFLSAANAYMEAGGSPRYVAHLIKHFGETALPEIHQAAIDNAATELHPNVTAGTRNCYVYTPVSAILHHALGDKCPTVRRPKGAKGTVKKDFMWPEVAFAILDAADAIDLEFGLYLLILLYQGPRKGEGLGLLAEDIRIAERAAYIRDSKNGDPRMLRIRKDILGRLEAHLERIGGRTKLFRFHDGGHFKHLLLRAKLAVCGLPCPKRRPTGWKTPKYRLSFVTFHTFRHSFATWFRFAGGDTRGLVGTGNWRDERSAARYAHVVAHQEWDRVEMFPAMPKVGA